MLDIEKIYSFKAASLTEGSRRLTEVTDAGHPVPIHPQRLYLTITYKFKLLKKVAKLKAQDFIAETGNCPLGLEKIILDKCQ